MRNPIDELSGFGCLMAEPRLSEADPLAEQLYRDSRPEIQAVVKMTLKLRQEVRESLERAHDENKAHLRPLAWRRLLESLLTKFSEVEDRAQNALRRMIDALPDDELGFPSLDSLSNFLPLMRFARITVLDIETLFGVPGRRTASAFAACEQAVFSDPRGAGSEPETSTYADRVVDELRRLAREEGLEWMA